MSVIDLPKPAWMQPDHEMLAEQAGKFFENEVAPRYEAFEKAGIFDRDVWEQAGAHGLLSPSVPEEFGGPGGDFGHDAVITHQANLHGCDGFGGPLHSAIVTPYILHYGSTEQKQRWLPKLVSGEYIAAIAMTEPSAGSDLQGVRTTAKRDGNHYVINGSKTFITNGQLANLIVLVTKTDPSAGAKGTSLFVIETDKVEGFRRGRNLDKIGMHSNDTSELFFDDVRVPADALLGPEEGQGFIQLMQQLPQERLLIGVYAMGRIERAIKVTLEYVKERKAFGNRIIDFQNSQFVLAECKTEATVARAFLDNCIERHMKDGLDATTASMAKYWLTDLQCKIIDRCLQLHGGYGYMNEYPIARMYRDARVERIYGGTNEVMKLLIARSL